MWKTTSPEAPPPGSSTEGMIWIPSGAFYMGSEDGQSDEKPVHRVIIDGFWMDKTEVINEQFARFVRETGYTTTAERKPDPKDFPGVPLENLVAGAIVFAPPPGDVPLDDHFAWWRYQAGAIWRQPVVPGSTLEGREKHPAVQVSCGMTPWPLGSLGRQAPSHRSRMGVCGSRRADWPALHLGQGACAGWQVAGKHLAGRVSQPERPLRRLSRNGSRGFLSPKRIRAL